MTIKTPEPREDVISDAEYWEKRMDEWRNRTPEQIAEARARIFASSRKARPLPPGKTLEDVFVGQWPGDETDEEIDALLKDR